MLFTKLSNLQIIYTGTHLTVADMLSRDSSISKKRQLQHKTFPPHIEFFQLKSNNHPKQNHYLVKHEEVLSTPKNDPPNLVDYSENQFTLRIHGKGNTVTYTPPASFLYLSVSSFSNKHKKPIKRKLKHCSNKILFLVNVICMKMMMLVLTAFLNKTQSHLNHLILFIQSSLEVNTKFSTTLIFLKTS